MSAKSTGTILTFVVKCYYKVKIGWEIEDLNSILNQPQSMCLALEKSFNSSVKISCM